MFYCFHPDCRSNSVALTTAGFYGDVLHLRRLLQSRMAKYEFSYRTPMSVDLCSEMLARNLYYNRFFPLYTGVVLAGVTEDGEFTQIAFC
jgi:20S proteasome alpha/beta subunit